MRPVPRTLCRRRFGGRASIRRLSRATSGQHVPGCLPSPATWSRPTARARRRGGGPMNSTRRRAAPEAGGSDELNSALDRTLVAGAFARLSAEDRAVVRRAFYYGWSTAQIGAALRNA